MIDEPDREMQKEFLEKLNSDASFRNQFLDHPSRTVKEFGFSLDSDDEMKLEGIVCYLKDDIKHIFEIPSGYSSLLKNMRFEIKMPPKVEVDTETAKIIPP